MRHFERRPLYLFDLDGTLCDPAHRRHLLSGVRNDAKWRQFFAACVDDAPVWPVIETMERLRHHADVWVFSARSDEVREQTVTWLTRHTSFTAGELDLALTMRAAGDCRPDEVLKRAWLDSMLQVDRERLVAVFDDRDKVVSMWRAAGVPCFQVVQYSE